MSSFSAVPLVCFEEASEQLNFEATDGSPLQLYLGTIGGYFGNDLILVEAVTKPPLLTAELTALDFNGVNVSCFEATDGGLEIAAFGGVSPYEYAWNTGSDEISLNDLPTGNYTVTITDDYGCKAIFEKSLTMGRGTDLFGLPKSND